MTTTVQCPQCQKPVTWDDTSAWKPFCSERCKLIDLGDWAEGNHRVAGPKTEDAFPDDLDHFDYH
jgi:endogenous inhibitor of DNA gyrase (YacG/DUF329 family)